MNYLFAIATEAPMPSQAQAPPQPPTDGDEGGNWLCCFWKAMSDAMKEDVFVPTPAAFIPTQAGTRAVVDEIFRHDIFKKTLRHASHIIHHITLSYLPTAPWAFRDLWTSVIVPAWLEHADNSTMSS
jgi:hypothetical protein